MFLDIIHRLVFIRKHRPVYFSKHNVSETGFSLRLQVKPTIKGPEIGTSSIDWAQLSRFYLKTETESSLRNVVFCNINRTVFLHKESWIMSRNIIFVQITNESNIFQTIQPADIAHPLSQAIKCCSTCCNTSKVA
jgi:hypothetical protein